MPAALRVVLPVALPVAFAVALGAFALGCSPSSGGPPQTAIVVGVASEPLAGALGWLEVKTTVAGKTTSTKMDAQALPYERTVTAPAGQPTAPLDVQVSGYAGPRSAAPSQPLVVRTAETAFVPNETRLLRVEIQAACLLGLPGGPPGGPICSAPQTCIGGACAADVVHAPSLPLYTADWASTTPDICKPANAGPPDVQVGTGQTDYLPLVSGQTVQMEAGPQGGHHIWIATRQQNLSQMGTITSLSSVQPGTFTLLAGPTLSFVFNFEQDQGGFCKLYGLRYQVDVDGADYHLFLGKPLDVTVTLKDPSGAIGVGHAHINIDPTLLCPSGDGGCN